MIVNNKNLAILKNRLLADKYSGTTFEKLVENFLSNISGQHTYIDNFTNRFDIETIETDYSGTELEAYVDQYAYILRDIINIPYPNLLKNSTFHSGSEYWKLYYSIINQRATGNSNATTLLSNWKSTFKDQFKSAIFPPNIDKSTLIKDRFGDSMSCSETYFAISSFYDANNFGVVSVYNTLGKILINITNPNTNTTNTVDNFGFSTSIYSNSIAISAKTEDYTGIADSGVVYVFDIETGALKFTLVSPNPVIGGQFGHSIDTDGNHIVISELGTQKVYVYNVNYDTNVTSLIKTYDNQNINATNTVDMFGGTVKLSGEHVVITAILEDSNAITDSGVVYVVNIGTDAFTVIGNPESGSVKYKDYFGTSISASSDKIAIGVPGYDYGTVSGCGIVYIYDTATGLLKQSIRNNKILTNNKFGNSVTLTDKTLIVGIPGELVNNRVGSGAISTYKKNINSNKFEFKNTILDKNLYGISEYDQFGYNIVGNDSFFVVGTQYEDYRTDASGMCYLYSTEPEENITILDSEKINTGEYVFNPKTKSFEFIKTDSDKTLWNYLIQDASFTGVENFEVYFEVESISDNTDLYVYALTKFDKINQYDPSSWVTKPGIYSFRIKRADVGDNYSDDLIFKFNGSVKIKNVRVQEYGRILKEDINILTNQIIQNKGRLGLYSFLFNLLRNLGSDSNTDLAIKVDVNDVITIPENLRLSVSEVYSDSLQNIKYDQNKTDVSKYTFSGQDIYESGYLFKEYVSRYNVDNVIPFTYKIEATFSEDVFKKFILPIAHPIGWEIIFNVYKSIECYDDLKLVSTTTEIDTSTYQHNLFFYFDTSKITINYPLGTPTYEHDILASMLFVEDIKEYQNIDIKTDTLDISLSTEIRNYYQKDTMSDSIDISLTSDVYFKDFNNFFSADDNVNITNFIQSIKNVENIGIYFDVLETQNINVLENYYQKDNLFGDVLDSFMFIGEGKYFEDINLDDSGLDQVIITLTDPSIKQEKNIIEPSDTLSSYLDYTYGSVIEYCDGSEEAYVEEDTLYNVFDNDSIGVKVIIKHTNTSESVNATLVQNITIIKKVMNFGHGIDGYNYLYLGTSGVGVNLTVVNFESGDWYALDTRVPA